MANKAKRESMTETVTESMDELNKEHERSSEPKCSTSEEVVISDEELNRKATNIEPVKKNQSDLNQMKFKKPKEELKDKRFSLLVKPSLYNRLKDLAAEQDTSVNNVINVILESVLEAQKGK